MRDLQAAIRDLTQAYDYLGELQFAPGDTMSMLRASNARVLIRSAINRLTPTNVIPLLRPEDDDPRPVA